MNTEEEEEEEGFSYDQAICVGEENERNNQR
jgi:hypothetical protein